LFDTMVFGHREAISYKYGITLKRKMKMYQENNQILPFLDRSSCFRESRSKINA